MPFYPVRDDITRMKVDIIVNATDMYLSGGGGVDAAIHRAAGPGLSMECRTIYRCGIGEAKITNGFGLPAKYVIHTAGPVYYDGLHGEETLLRSCYRNSLNLAMAYEAESLAFPLISAGTFRYPREEAIRIASEEIIAFLDDYDDMTVYLVLFDEDSFQAGKLRYPDLESRLEWKECKARFHNVCFSWKQLSASTEGAISASELRRAEQEDTDSKPIPGQDEISYETGAGVSGDADEGEQLFAPETVNEPEEAEGQLSLNGIGFEPGEPAGETAAQERSKLSSIEALDEFQRDESFTEMLFRCIDESGMTDSECYHKANIDRRLFSKIRSNIEYKPSKPTALAFAVALKMDITKTEIFLKRAGLAFNGRDTFDIIVEYFITVKNYNIHDINEVLFNHDQQLLGNCARE